MSSLFSINIHTSLFTIHFSQLRSFNFFLRRLLYLNFFPVLFSLFLTSLSYKHSGFISLAKSAPLHSFTHPSPRHTLFFLSFFPPSLPPSLPYFLPPHSVLCPPLFNLAQSASPASLFPLIASLLSFSSSHFPTLKLHSFLSLFPTFFSLHFFSISLTF